MPQQPDKRRGELLRLMYHDEMSPQCGESIIELVDTYDETKIKPSKPAGESYRATTTLRNWFSKLTVFGRSCDLATCTTDDILRQLQAMRDGTHAEITGISGSGDGVSDGTLHAYASVLRVFYRHFDFGIDPTEIPTQTGTHTPVDPTDILTGEEIDMARDACRNPRDKLIFDLLLYTGQRRYALVKLRIKDIDLESGTYRYNTDAGGLKGAEKRNGRRPLLGAAGSVREYINTYHRNPTPESYLITQLPSYKKYDGSESVAPDLLYKVMQRIKDDSGITKPMTPHMMRHCFVTICKRDYGMDNDTIKYLIGHAKDSTVMETTYAHLTGDDYVHNAEEAWGLKEAEDKSPLTPPVCTSCYEPMPSRSSKACPSCGATYTPDATSIQEQLADEQHEVTRSAETEEERVTADAFRELIKENKEEIINILDDT